MYGHIEIECSKETLRECFVSLSTPFIWVLSGV